MIPISKSANTLANNKAISANCIPLSKLKSFIIRRIINKSTPFRNILIFFITLGLFLLLLLLLLSLSE